MIFLFNVRCGERSQRWVLAHPLLILFEVSWRFFGFEMIVKVTLLHLRTVFNYWLLDRLAINVWFERDTFHLLLDLFLLPFFLCLKLFLLDLFCLSVELLKGRSRSHFFATAPIFQDLLCAFRKNWLER